MTMTELAKLANVSQSMVSLVLNNKAGGRIALKRQEEILRLAKKHNFRPNQAAKKLRSNDKNLIGIAMVAPLAPSYRKRIVNLQHKLNQLNYHAVFVFWENIEQIPAAINEIMNFGINGLICWDYHPCLDKEHIPIVLYEQQNDNYDCVVIDYYDYATQLVNYIKKLNHQKVAFIGNCGTESPNLRFNYLKQQLPLHGIKIDSAWIKYGDEKIQDGYEAFGEIMKEQEKPTMIITHSDTTAQGVYYKAHQLGIKIPDDISIISSNNMDICEYLMPSLSSFSINIDKLDSALVELVIQRLKQTDTTCKYIAIKGNLIERESSREYG